MSLVRHRKSSLGQLRDLDLFRRCTDKELNRVEGLVCSQEVGVGTVLCRQGTVGRQAFVILSGRAEVRIDDVQVSTLGPGGFFGEMSVFDRCPRAATVIALTPMTVLVLTSLELESLLADVPTVARQMLATVSARLRDADRAFGEPAPLIATP